MAVPKAIVNRNRKRLKFIEDSADSFQSNIPDRQKTALKRIINLIASLDIDEDGRIKATVANQNAVQRVTSIRNDIITKSYVNDVNTFLDKFDKTKEQTDSYYINLPENA